MSEPAPLSPRLTAAALALALTGCAGGPTPEAPAPPPPAPAAAAPAAPRVVGALEPSEAALRVSQRVELTGTELGTMWTFENPPFDYWREAHAFTPTAEWLEHVRLASVRYGESCSASFVSPTGLVLTNWHCALECVEALSTAERDLVVEGFHAATRSEELTCPGLFLDQLVSIEDVTARIVDAGGTGTGAEAVMEAKQRVASEIEEGCVAETQLACQVVELYHGGQYQLYRFRRYEPVKLVFAPERQAGFFGGDPDNFTYPRYNLDVAFVRAYGDDGQPAATPQFFEWDPEGAEPGELVLVTGNPGTTSRLITVSELLFEQRFNHPLNVAWLEGQRDILREIAATSPEAERAVRDQLFSVENSLKAFTGQLDGLLDTLLVGRKIRWEDEFRSRIEADPSLRARYATLWDSMAVIQAEKLRLGPAVYFASPGFGGIPQLQVADGIVDLLQGRGVLPGSAEGELPPGGTEALADQLREAQLPPAGAAARVLAVRLRLMRRWFDDEHPLVRAAFREGEDAASAAGRLLRETGLAEEEFRAALLEEGAGARAAADPLVAFALAMDTLLAGIPERWEALESAEEVLESSLADALFAAFGTAIPPDATFTLRVSDGVVARYPYNGTFAPPYTTFHGLFGRALGFGNEDPWRLPETFAARREALDLSAPLNFVTTNDITGGNSGSPMIDRDARVVGVAFDSNIEGLHNQFLFRATAGRTVGVHSRGILEALRAVYQADGLVAEILGEGAR